MFYILNTSFVLWPTWPDKFISLIVTYQGFYPQTEPIVTLQSKDDRSFMCPSEYLVPSIGRTAPKPMVIEPFYNCPRVPCTSPGTWVVLSQPWRRTPRIRLLLETRMCLVVILMIRLGMTTHFRLITDPKYLTLFTVTLCCSQWFM